MQINDVSTYFNPSIQDEAGIGTVYEDGSVSGAVDEFVFREKRALVISEWTSNRPGNGHTKRALEWLRAQGFENIVANGVGLIEYGIGDVATAYWQHIHALGLVDVLLDDDGADVTPKKPSTRINHSFSPG